MGVPNAGHIHKGPVTIIFNGGEIVFAQDVEIRPRSEVTEVPDVESASAPLDVRVTNRGLDVYVKSMEQTPKTIAWVLGVSSSRIGPPNGTIRLTVDATDTSTDIGPVSVAFTRNDGALCRYYIKRAAVVPTNEAIPIGKKHYTTGSFILRTLDPQDGSNKPFYFEVSA